MHFPSNMARQIVWAVLFAVAFGLVEAAVVVYLRALYYPEGFRFPLSVMQMDHVGIELAREGATIVMLAAVAALAGRARSQRVGIFLVVFAVWDLFYYVWLKVLVDWPASFLDWDVLFLIPLPWIGPVVAPVLISGTLIAAGLAFIVGQKQSPPLRLGRIGWIVAGGSTVILLYTFMADTAATLHGSAPLPYNYGLFALGMIGYGSIIVQLWRRVWVGSRRSLSRPEEKIS